MKKAFKLGSRASFLTARSLYLFQIAHFSQKFQFSAGIVRWWHVQSCSGIHVTTRLTWSELTRLTTLVSKIMLLNRVRYGSLGVKTSNARRYLVVRSSSFYFFLKYVRWLYVPSEVHVATYRYFFARSRMKKAFKLAMQACVIHSCMPSDGTYELHY